MEYYEYDEGATEDDEDGARPKIYTAINNRGDYIEYHYNSGSVITNSVQKVKRYQYIGNFAYQTENLSETLTKDLRNETVYTYNQFGQLTGESLQYYTKLSDGTAGPPFPNVISSSSSYETAEGSKIFGALTSQTDSLNRTTRYFYDTSFGYLLAVIMPDGNGTAYRYDDLGNLWGIFPAIYNESTESYTEVTGTESVGYGYDGKNRLCYIVTDTVMYTLDYDVFGNTESISIGTRTLAEYEYQEKNGKLTSMTYGNGCTVYYLYDELENLSELWYSYNGGETITAAYTYTYGADNQLCRFDNLLTEKSIVYTYDSFGRLTGFAEYDTESMKNTLGMRQTYNEQGQLMEVTYRAPYSHSNGTSDWLARYAYSYGTDGGEGADTLEASNITWGSPFHTILSTQYEYDVLNRLTAQTNTYGSGTTSFEAEITYSYLTSGTNTSGIVSQYTSIFNGNESEYDYVYDDNGNITQISVNGVVKYRYQYDNIGQLIREDNADTGKTYVNEYDDSGNILSKKLYSYTTAETPTGTPTVYEYTYGDTTWGDLLTGYQGHKITYDEIGNPISNYNNGTAYSYTWTQGRRLDTASDGESYMTFTYDDNGVRTGKTVGSDVYIYNVEGTRILSESWGTNLLVYLYDDNGLPTGMQYRKTSYAEDVYDTFWFEKNLQGDIIAIYNNAGVKLSSYTYDAWGNFTVTYTNGGATTAAQYNPFTYRSYYYDDDLGLYYLNSRYYDSNTGRFISADGQLNSSLLGYNLFVYGLNSPVNFVDYDGNMPSWLKYTLGAVAFVAASVVVAAALGALAPAAICAASQILGYYGVSMATATVIATVGAAVVTTAAATYAGDMAYQAVTGDSILLETVFMGNEKAYQIGAFITNLATLGYLDLAMQGLQMGVCFVAGTLVETENGSVPIEEITAGMLVYAHNPDTEGTELKEVVQTFVNETNELVHIKVSGEEIISTPTHPFWVPQKGWTDAIQLRAGDRLQLLNGEYVIVEQVQHEILEAPVTVYNFEVEDFHTYYVSDSAILVHNTCGQQKGVGGKGWVGDKTWKENVRTVNQGGTITQLNGGIPTRQQAIRLIGDAGGSVVRIEGPHQYPNPHTFSHINYITSSGIKGTIKIFE